MLIAGRKHTIGSTLNEEQSRMAGGPPKPIDALDALSVSELTALIAAAEKKKTEKIEEGRLSLISEFKSKAEELGLSFETVMGSRNSSAKVPGRPPKMKAPGKYRGPNGEEWSGRGRPPEWITSAEANGQNRTDFLIKA